MLEEWFHQPVKGMAYPGGTYNADVEVAVGKAGYVYAQTASSARRKMFPVADPYAPEGQPAPQGPEVLG